MRCKILRSGSSGNCTLVEHSNYRILIDAGFSQKRILEILEESNIDTSTISAIIVTHCHADHINYSTLQICRKFNIPIWVNESNVNVLHSLYKKSLIEQCKINSFSSAVFCINELCIQPFEISHDAAGKTFGFSIKSTSGTNQSITYAADLGCFPDSLIPFFVDSKVIIIEANHDTELLWKNPLRPYTHKKRVTGDYGHLSNVQSADALLRICRCADQLPMFVVLCHLSEDHNTPDLARTTIGQLLKNEGYHVNLVVAQRKEPTAFIEI